MRDHAARVRDRGEGSGCHIDWWRASRCCAACIKGGARQRAPGTLAASAMAGGSVGDARCVGDARTSAARATRAAGSIAGCIL